MKVTEIINLESRGSVADTIARLESLLTAKGLKVFSRIDQAEEARAVGLTLPPMVLLFFGDPKVGIPFMIQHPSVAIDLPLKALVWESAEGKVWLTYCSPESMQQRHGLQVPPFVSVVKLLQAAAA